MELWEQDSELFDWYSQSEQDQIDQSLFYFSGKSDEQLDRIDNNAFQGISAGVQWPRLVNFVLDLGDGRQVTKTIQDPGNLFQGAPNTLSGTMRRSSDGGYEVVANWDNATGFDRALANWRQFDVKADLLFYSPGKISEVAETLPNAATIEKTIAAKAKALEIQTAEQGSSKAEYSTTTSNDSQITINTDLLFLANGLRPGTGKLLKLNSNNSGMPHPDDLDLDPSFDWKLVLGGKDGASMSDETFLYYYRQAIKDFAMKDVIPGGITVTQKIFGVAASVADVPLWSNAPIPKSVIGLNYAVQFPGEILKNLSTHYNDINYTWEHAVADAFKTKGIETVADMTAEGLGKYIAKRYNMDESSKWLLTKGLNMVFEEYGKKAVKEI